MNKRIKRKFDKRRRAIKALVLLICQAEHEDVLLAHKLGLGHSLKKQLKFYRSRYCGGPLGGG